MQIHRATNAENAIKIQVSSTDLNSADYEIDKYIMEIFGKNDGEFFIHSSRIVEDFTKTRRFKVYLIEDKDKDKHTVFFELIKDNNENKTGPKTFGSQSRYI